MHAMTTTELPSDNLEILPAVAILIEDNSIGNDRRSDTPTRSESSNPTNNIPTLDCQNDVLDILQPLEHWRTTNSQEFAMRRKPSHASTECRPTISKKRKDV